MLEVGELRLDPATRQAWRGERGVELSTKEFALLEAFMRRPGEVLSRLELLEHAWDFGYENRSNVIDVYVRYLREKIDRPFGVTSIETVRGAGYRLREDGGAPLSRLPVRIRLTLAFTAVMAVVLVAVGLFVYARVGSDLEAALDNSLRSRADDLAGTGGWRQARLVGPGPPRGERREPRSGDRARRQGRLLERWAEQPPGPHEATSSRAPGRARCSSNRDSVAGFDERMRLLAQAHGQRRGRGGRHARGPRRGAVVARHGPAHRRPDRPAARGARRLRAGHRRAAARGRDASTRPRRSRAWAAAGGCRCRPAGDELAKLGGTLNEMLERLERSAERERGFVASASHELRTPLALLKAELELALREGRTAEELRAARGVGRR